MGPRSRSGSPGADEIGGEGVGVDEEPLVEGALGVVAIERRQDQPRDQQDHEAPEDRRDREADRDRAARENGRANDG